MTRSHQQTTGRGSARRAVLGVAVALLALAPARARCAPRLRFAGAHVSYGLGGAAAEESGVRHTLDAGLMLGWMREQHSRIGLWSTVRGWIFGASVATGFGLSPTYTALEAGWGISTRLAAFGAVIGPAFRVSERFGAGASLRLAGDLLLGQLGVRLVVVGPGAELQATMTLGVGRF